MYKIYVDCGHGGAETSTVATHDGVTLIERDVNLVMANLLTEKLRRLEDVEVLQSRLTNDLSAPNDMGNFTDSAYRCNLWGTYNNQPVDLMISIHNNGWRGTDRGYQIIHSVKQPADLAFLIAEGYDAIGIARNKIYSRQYSGGMWDSAPGQLAAPTQEMDYYAIIRETIANGHTRALIVETCFLDNREDALTWIWDIQKGEYRMDKLEAFMEVILRAIRKFAGLKDKPIYVPPSEPVPEPEPPAEADEMIFSCSVSVGNGYAVSLVRDRAEGDFDIYQLTVHRAK